jgi:hypothetical protein
LVLQSCPEEIFQFVDDDVVDRSIESGGNVVDTIATVGKLSNYQKTKLATFLNSEIQRFDRVSGHTSAIQHTIKTGDAEPIKQRYYPVTPVIQQVINEEIDKLLKEGAIEPSVSAWSSPIVMVKKPNGEYRICLDFRKVNAVTKKDSYPLPYIEDILRKLRSAKPLTLKMVIDRSHLNLPAGKRLLLLFRVRDYSSLWLCRLDCVMHRQPSRDCWIR